MYNLLTRSHATTYALDLIPTNLLPISKHLPAVTHVINSSMASETFPASFKWVGAPAQKKSFDPAEVENYNLLSLLFFLSKAIGRAVFNHVSDFLIQNTLLDPNQPGFKSGHSTKMALLSVTEVLRAAGSSVLILLDLSTTFDTVNDHILLFPFSKMGISGKLLP